MTVSFFGVIRQASTADGAKPSIISSSVFSMFGGGAKKKKEDEDRGDVSGSAKAQREAAKADDVSLSPLLYFPFIYLTNRSFPILSA